MSRIVTEYIAHNHIKILYKGQDIDCYGEMSETQNIEVTCSDEDNDFCLPEGFETWQGAVEHLVDEMDMEDIQQLQAV